MCGDAGDPVHPVADVFIVVYEAAAEGIVGAVLVEGVAAEVFEKCRVMSV